jgi:hypothetical protein
MEVGRGVEVNKEVEGMVGIEGEQENESRFVFGVIFKVKFHCQKISF